MLEIVYSEFLPANKVAHSLSGARLSSNLSVWMEEILSYVWVSVEQADLANTHQCNSCPVSEKSY